MSIGNVDLVGLREAKEEAYNKLYRMKKGEDLNFTMAVENSSHDSLPLAHSSTLARIMQISGEPLWFS